MAQYQQQLQQWRRRRRHPLTRWLGCLLIASSIALPSADCLCPAASTATVARSRTRAAALRSSASSSFDVPAAAAASAAGIDVPESTESSPSSAPAGRDGPRSRNPSHSRAARWHKDRRRRMLLKYGDRIGPLERDASSHALALSLLCLSNASLFAFSLLSGKLHPLRVTLLALFPGSMFSLWTLQILHDLLHGSLLKKRRRTFLGVRRKDLQDLLLFWGSMPSAFGYYLYLKYGHLTHHKSLGDERSASLKQLFESDQKEFEDGDVLFVAHRMKLKGEVGPTFNIGGKDITMSISKTGFDAWREGRPIRNACAFASSFMYERGMLVVNDLVVAATGRNYFFPNKPKEFHDECAKYCRCAVAVRALLWKLAGWKSMLFLFLSETLWSIPPHPACAMFVTNHGSNVDEDSGNCVPSSSTYAGRWYSVFTLGTNYHCEHHDFPTIPLHRLGELRKIAPEFYPEGSRDNVFRIMRKVFAKPEFYACMDAASL
ncbi:hypothetical protein ACHAWF_007093 [Thalassiosira exigua]